VETRRRTYPCGGLAAELRTEFEKWILSRANGIKKSREGTGEGASNPFTVRKVAGESRLSAKYFWRTAIGNVIVHPSLLTMILGE
jgi:hypothetical protein